jgi:ribonucleoside-diphosphate reductase alpha chain
MKADQKAMMTNRKRLPDRRNNVSFGFDFEGFTYRATAGHFDDGTLAEIFLDVPGKLGTPLQSNANTAAVLTSLLLQHGVAPEVISHSITGPISIALAGFSKVLQQGEHST